MKQLWEEQTKMKTSISTLENSILELRGDFQKLTEIVENKLSAERFLGKEMKEELDKKVVGFLESANETWHVTMSRTELKLKAELDQLKIQVAAQESRLLTSWLYEELP